MLSLTDHLKQSEIRTKHATSTRHQEKLDKLRKKQSKPFRPSSTTNNKQRWVHNLSSKTFSESQVNVLQKGFKFAIAPSQIPTLDFVSGVEFGLRQVEDLSRVMTARSKVTEILKSAKSPKSNLTKDEEIAFQQLKSDSMIKILKADKGNSTVVMDSSAYDCKFKELLTNDSVYKQLPDTNPILQPRCCRGSMNSCGNCSKMIKLVNRIILIFEVIKVYCLDFTVCPKYIKLICHLDPLCRLWIRLLIIFPNFCAKLFCLFWKIRTV